MRINKNIVAKSKLLLNPLFPTLKKGIIQLFIVSLPKVPEFWCSFFLKHKITNFRELLFYYRKKFKQLQIESTTKFIPKSIKTDLSENTLSRLEHFEKKSKSLKYLLLGSFSCLGIAIIVMFLSFYLSKQWYDTSIKTKEEIRSQIFKEMRTEGKEFYDIEVFNQLKMNTEIINKWIERNPKQGNNFLKFKEGYEAK